MEFIISCPHCSGLITVHSQEINCRIFRHGVYPDGSLVPPHASEAECKEAIEKGALGCCKPFEIELISDNWVAKKCDYI